METGYNGAFVISWSQTELDGVSAAPIDSLTVGATWAWGGELVRVDRSKGVLRLDETDESEVRRKGAANLVRRLVKAAKSDARALERLHDDDPAPDIGFVVTDGLKAYSVSLVPVGVGTPPLLMFLDDVPPKNRDLWVAHLSLDPQVQNRIHPDCSGVICFTPGTLLQTPKGARPVEELREGEEVITKENGAEAIEWIGSRKMTGARLFAMPHLRPIRLRAGSLGIGTPDKELLVSPEHRVSIQGKVARALFKMPEVLVSAKDLVNHDTIDVDQNVREVTYIHLLFPRHQIISVHGVETESFHPGFTAISTLDEEDRVRLLSLYPQLETQALTPEESLRAAISASLKRSV